MKQMKFLLVALMAVVMSVSVTSCMNGENNPVYTGLAVAECVSTYPATFAVSNNQKLVVKDATLLDLANNLLNLKSQLSKLIAGFFLSKYELSHLNAD